MTEIQKIALIGSRAFSASVLTHRYCQKERSYMQRQESLSQVIELKWYVSKQSTRSSKRDETD